MRRCTNGSEVPRCATGPTVAWTSRRSGETMLPKPDGAFACAAGRRQSPAAVASSLQRLVDGLLDIFAANVTYLMHPLPPASPSSIFRR